MTFRRGVVVPTSIWRRSSESRPCRSRRYALLLLGRRPFCPSGRGHSLLFVTIKTHAGLNEEWRIYPPTGQVRSFDLRINLQVHPSPVRSGAFAFVLDVSFTLDDVSVDFNPAPAEQHGPNYRALPPSAPDV